MSEGQSDIHLASTFLTKIHQASIQLFPEEEKKTLFKQANSDPYESVT